MIEASGLGLALGGRSVFAGIDLRLAPGERIGIVGASGAGKSSLLRMAAGLTRPSAGLWRNDFVRTAMAFQQPALLPWRSVRDNLRIPLRASGLDARATAHRADQWLARMDLAGRGADWPRQLSGGMAQRLGLARAMAVGPDLLLLDEPFSALDERLRERLLADCRAWLAQTGAALICVSHQPDDLARLVDRCLVIHGGRGRWLEAESPAALAREIRGALHPFSHSTDSE